jgi:hypothetical protein
MLFETQRAIFEDGVKKCPKKFASFRLVSKKTGLNWFRESGLQ